MRYFILGLTFLLSQTVLAQTNGDYRTRNTGNWNGITTWQVFLGGVWVNTITSPNSTDGAIEIMASHVVTVTGNVSVDQVTVNGTLSVNSGIILSAGPNASMLAVNSGGIVINAGTIAGTATSNTFNAGAIYRHNHTGVSSGGAVPLATWNVTSTVQVIGYSGNTSYSLTSTTWSQAFGNFEFNCNLNNNREVDFAGLLTTITGNFSILGTGSGRVVLATNQTYSMTVAGNFTMSAGTLILKTNTSGSTAINMRGNFNYAGGTIDVLNSNVNAALNFNGTGIQTFSRTSVNGFATGNPTSRAINMTIASGSTVDMGTSSFNGNGSFVLNGTLRTANTAGLNGSLQNVGTKTFNANSTIVYNGTLAQVMGSLYPGAPAAGINVVINNAAGVTTSSLTNPVTTVTTITGNLNLISGNLLVGNTHTLQLNGTLSRTIGNINMNNAFNSANLIINGSGALGVDPFPFSGDQIFSGLTVNRSGQTVTLGNNVDLRGAATLTTGTLAIASNQLTLNGNIAVTAGLLSGTGSSALTISGAGTTSTINFAPGGNTLGTLIMNRGGAGISFGGDYSLTNTLDVIAGTLNGNNNTITMQGSTWSMASALSFSPGTSLVIFDGNTTVSSPTSTDFHHIQLNASRTLTFPSTIVNSSGNINFSSSGTFNHNNGTLRLNGGATQTFAGGNHQYYNITVNKAGGDVSLGGAVNLISVLDVQSATNFQSNGNLTLLSTGDDPDITASIYSLLGGAQVSGNVHVQRRMSGEGRIYRYISSPVSGAMVSDWMDDFPVTGTFTDPSTTDPNTGLTTICGLQLRPTSPSLYFYNETVAGALANGWTTYPPNGQASTSTPIVVGRGYAPFIRECTNPTNIDLTGVINQGTINLPVSFTGSTPDPDGWNLVANPYPSSIIWDAGAGWTKNNISSIIAIRDNGSGGIFQYLDETEGGTVASSQAFWTLAIGEAPQLQINELSKSLVNGSFYRESTEVHNVLTLQVTKGNLTDKTYFRVRPDATAGFDRYDFPKLDNEEFDVALLSGSKVLAVNAVNQIGCQETVPVHIKDMAVGTYIFNAVSEGLFIGYTVTLFDRFTGTSTIISETDKYSFSVTSAAASKASNRFEVRLSPRQINAAAEVNQGNGTLCGQAYYEIEIVSPQPYVSYYAQLGGEPVSEIMEAYSSSSSLKLRVPATAFNAGENQVIIKAFTSCEQTALATLVTVNKEAKYLATASPATVCTAGSTSISAAGAPENGNYAWYETADSAVPVFIGNPFVTPDLTSSTTYYVSAVNTIGCEGDRIPVKVTVSVIQEASVKIQSKNKLMSNYAFGNQWYFNDELIPGAKHQHLTVTKSGTYRVEVSVNGCTTSASLDYQVIRGNENESVTVFPNPVSSNDRLVLEFSANTPEVTQIMTSTGVTVMKLEVEPLAPGVWGSSVDVSTLTPGIYFVRVTADNQTKTVKFIRVP